MFESTPAQPAQVEYAGRTANRMPVSYTRQQQGHSLTKHLLLGWILLWIPAIYYSISPNHYWRA